MNDIAGDWLGGVRVSGAHAALQYILKRARSLARSLAYLTSPPVIRLVRNLALALLLNHRDLHTRACIIFL